VVRRTGQVGGQNKAILSEVGGVVDCRTKIHGAAGFAPAMFELKRIVKVW
jgi:hypothetical protein